MRSSLAFCVVLIGAMAMCGFPEGDSVAQPPKGKRLALLVGVTAYDSSRFATLKYTENDAEELAKLLSKSESGFDEVRVLTTTRGKKNRKDAPTAENIRAALEKLLERRGKGDTVLVALAGHGVQLEVKDPEEKDSPKTYSYFCPVDADLLGVSYKTGGSKTLINLDDLFDTLGKSGAGGKLVLVDACRNELSVKGQAHSLDAKRVTVPDGVGALFSCGPGQVAFETEKLKHGVFFHFVIEGLKGEAKNRRGAVTWDTLADYVKEEVTEQTGKIIGGGARQTPHGLSNLQGASPVLVTAAKSPPPQEPPLIRAEIVGFDLGRKILSLQSGGKITEYTITKDTQFYSYAGLKVKPALDNSRVKIGTSVEILADGSNLKELYFLTAPPAVKNRGNIAELMRKMHAPNTGLQKQYIAAFNKRDLDSAKRVASEWRAAAEQLKPLTPPKGSKSSWEQLTSAYVNAVRELDAQAGKATKKTLKMPSGDIGKSCGGCHTAHKGK